MNRVTGHKGFLIVFAALPCILYACSSRGNVEQITNIHIVANEKKFENPVTITFWVGNMTPEKDKFFRESIVEPFERKYPDIHVDYLGIPGMPFEKVDTSLAAGTPPNVAFTTFKAHYINRQALEPLDDYFMSSPIRRVIDPITIQINRSLDAKEGKLYGIPSTNMAWAIWVRTDWFKENHVKIPETWDEFFDAALRLTDPSQGRYGLSMMGGEGSAQILEYLMYAYSGIADMFTADGKSTINDPLHVEFIEKYLSLYNVATPEDDITKGWTELGATFQAGKAAMIAHNIGLGVPHEKAFVGDYRKFQAIPFPKSKRGYVNHLQLVPQGFTMFRESGNKEAAWKLIEFIADKEQNNAYAKLISEVPANMENLSEDWLKDTPWMEFGAQLLTDPETRFYSIPYHLPEYDTVRSIDIEPQIQKVMMKQISAQQMLDEWAKKLERANEEFQKEYN